MSSIATVAVSCSGPKHDEVAGGAQPTDIIPAPVEYSVQPVSIRTDELMQLPEKVRISESSVRRHPKGRDLADWQFKSAYRLEVGKKGVKIVAANEEGVCSPANISISAVMKPVSGTGNAARTARPG